MGRGRKRKEKASRMKMASRTVHQAQGAKHRRAPGPSDACEVSRQTTVTCKVKQKSPHKAAQDRGDTSVKKLGCIVLKIC